MNTILTTIVETIADKEGERFRSFSPQAYPLLRRPPPRPLFKQIERDFFVIAEVKRGSPSRGLFCPDLDPVRLAAAYEAGGASAISVITERHFFFGSPDYLTTVRTVTDLPLLCKDFLIHPCQIFDAYNWGADFILLIAACLNDDDLETMAQAARSLGLGILVEIHEAEDVGRAASCRPDLIGINNRDLRDFSVDFKRSLRLKESIPSGIPVISESGIHSHEQVRELREAGFAGILVGEHLIRSGDPRTALEELVHG